MIIVLVFFWFKKPYAQIINDTIYIKFKTNRDYLKKDNNKTYFYIKNELYEREKARYEKAVHDMDKDSVYPPNFRYPIKPNEYYQFFSNNYSKNLYDSLKIDDLIFYDRSKIKDLSPYKKLIVILKSENDTIECYPVSFYKNVRE